VYERGGGAGSPNDSTQRLGAEKETA
jgi:hypothetical protein